MDVRLTEAVRQCPQRRRNIFPLTRAQFFHALSQTRM
jgi:hypothetical protein